MIRRLRLRNFKCFETAGLNLGRLTLLTGINGAGKSSALQSLLLARQLLAPGSRGIAELNGPFQLELGRIEDVLFAHATEQTIELGLETDAGSAEWSFDAQDTDAAALTPRPAESRPIPPAVHCLTRQEFTYLGAERWGPRRAYGSLGVKRIVEVGAQGQFTAHVLLDREREAVRPSLRHPAATADGATAQLRPQVEAWMNDFIPNLEVRVHRSAESTAVVLQVKNRGLETDWLLPTNMGFGVAYALPIVVAGLLAPEASMFLVENPEAHLHPTAQSRMGRFLATVASAGVQVVAETHSDHVLNGVRLVVASGEPIGPDDVVIHHFGGADGAGGGFQTLSINERGSLSAWPGGFFDQSERDLAAILKARSRA